MRLDNQQFTAANISRIKSPHFVIALSFDNANNDVVYIRSSIQAALPDGAQTIAAQIKNISGQSQKINPDAANSTIGSLSLNIVDISSSLTNLIYDRLENGNGLRKKRLEVYVGYGDLSWGDYEQRYVYLIDNYEENNGVYSIKASDIQRLVRQSVFQQESTHLRESINETQMFIPIIGPGLNRFHTVEHDSTYTTRPNEEVGYVVFGSDKKKEIICHGGVINDPTHGICLQVVERGVFNTKPRRVEVKADLAEERRPKIEEYIYLEGAAPKIIYALLTGSLFNQPGKSLPDHWNLGIDSLYVRLIDFITIGQDLWDTASGEGRHVKFSGVKKVDGKRFIEQQLLLWLGAFMPVYSDGSLGLKRLTPILSNSNYIAELNEFNIVNYSSLKHDLKRVVNHFVVDWNWDYIQNRFLKREVFIDEVSISRNQFAPSRTIKFQGVHTSSHTEEDLFSAFNTMRDRYSDPPQVLSLTVLPSLNILEVGDTVNVSLPQIQDAAAGGTLERVFEIQQVATDWMTGQVKLSLFGSSQRAGAIKPFTLPNILSDRFYSAFGSNLDNLSQVTSGVLHSNLELSGADTNVDSTSVYYHIGDLEVANDVTLFINDNIQLRVMGHLTVNGKIDGAGRGVTGTQGGQLFLQNSQTTLATTVGAQERFNKSIPYPEDNAQPGNPQYLGKPIASGGVYLMPRSSDTETIVRNIVPQTATGDDQTVDTVPMLNIVNINNDQIQGIPTNLRGSSGGGGRASGYLMNQNWVLNGTGGNGGTGGAGLYIVCRGLSFGSGGEIDLSGTDGGLGNIGSGTPSGIWYAGSGAGGAPGALCVLYDGDHAVPDLISHVKNEQGASPVQGHINSTEFNQTIGDVTDPWYSAYIGKVRKNYDDAGFYFGYVPGQRVVNNDMPDVADDAVELVLQVIPNTPQTIEQNLSSIEITVVPPDAAGNSNYAYSMIYYREVGNTAWQLVGAADDEQILIVQADGKQYDIQARSVTLDGDESPEGIIRSIPVPPVVSPFIPPEQITNIIPSSGTAHLLVSGDGSIHSRIHLAWDASSNSTVRRYEVQYKVNSDTDYISAGIVESNRIYIMPVTDGKTYDIRLRAITITNTEGAWSSIQHNVIGKRQAPTEVENFNVSVDGFALLLTWNAVNEADLREYEIRKGNVWYSGDDPLSLLARIRSTSIRLDIEKAGFYEFMIKAVDTSNNYSTDFDSDSITITAPNIPNLSHDFNDEFLVINWAASATTYPVEEYEIRYGDTFASSTFIDRVKSETYSIKVNWLNRRFWVLAYDRAGNPGLATPIDINIQPYGAPVITPEVIDNNVLLHWNMPDANNGTLPISHYLIQKQNNDGVFEIGTTAGTFQQVFEQQPDTYTYLIRAIDTAGNEGAQASKVVLVNQPPDYILHQDWPSEFAGTKTNATVTVKGTLILPVNTAETYAQHFANNSWGSIRNKIDSGNTHYAEPSLKTASYIEDFDHGQVIQGTLISITTKIRQLSGRVNITPTIRVKENTGDAWTEYINVTQTFASNFRYVQIQLDFDCGGGANLIEIEQLDVKLSLKLIKDSGKGKVTDASNGLTVLFNKNFLDIQHLEVTVPNSGGGTASTLQFGIYDFVDVPSPTEFTAYIIRHIDGSKQIGNFFWTASGV